MKGGSRMATYVSRLPTVFAAWLVLVGFGLAAEAEDETPEYTVVVNRVRVESSLRYFSPGPQGDIIEFVAQVDYTVTARDGTKYENPTGGETPFTVQFSYSWDWVANREDHQERVADLVQVVSVDGPRSKIRYLKEGWFDVGVAVTATVTPKE